MEVASTSCRHCWRYSLPSGLRQSMKLCSVFITASSDSPCCCNPLITRPMSDMDMLPSSGVSGWLPGCSPTCTESDVAPCSLKVPEKEDHSVVVAPSVWEWTSCPRAGASLGAPLASRVVTPCPGAVTADRSVSVFMDCGPPKAPSAPPVWSTETFGRPPSPRPPGRPKWAPTACCQSPPAAPASRFSKL